jgi:glycosyltransferase involved in cell wall biosynthesis
VVTPNYDMGDYLAQTMESVLGNLRPGDEYFVIDGGSTDGSVGIIRSYEKRLTAWVSETDRGYADALAKGFARATGDILCWVNTGDLLLSGALDAARVAMAQTGADLIYGDDFYIDEEGRVIFFSRGYVRDLKAAMLFAGWTPLQDACFWRQELYRRVGGLDRALKHAADYDLFLRMALHGKVAYVPKAFSAFRRHPKQVSVHGAAMYREERERARHRELARLRAPALAKVLRRAWHALAVRWRVRVAQRRWKRLDLRGRNIDELACAIYWPRSATKAGAA